MKVSAQTLIAAAAVGLIVMTGATVALAQATAFAYLGRLTDAGSPSNGDYDFQFRLFDAVAGGNQIGATLLPENVAVANGVFSVVLDFGSPAFPGGNRFLEIAVRPGPSTDGFTTLEPRQPLMSVPYAVRSLSAASAETLSTAAAFTITGNGTAGIFSATSHFSIGADRILTNAGTNNLFAGVSAGASNIGGTANAFFGKNAGAANISGSSGTFIGYNAGAANTTGANNSFLGDASGFRNTTASNNSFFGFLSGFNNLDGASNSFFGSAAGQNNVTGSSNAFFGFLAGLNNLASSNSFFGRGAGFLNNAGTHNAFFGTNASDHNTSGSDNSSFGFNAGQLNTTGSGNAFFGAAAGDTNTTGSNITVIGAGADVGAVGLSFAGAFGAGAVVTASNTLVLGRNLDTVQVPGIFQPALGPPGGSPVCFNNGLSLCSSSFRYKTEIRRYLGGLDVAMRLDPIAFVWKDNGRNGIGFGAEDVATVEPRLTFSNDKGEIEGVHYAQITTVLVNAVKEQQAQIDTLKRRIEEIMAFVCRSDSPATICQN